MHRTYRDAGIQAVEVVRGTNHEDAVICFETIDLIQEVAADIVRDNAIQVLKYEVARCILSRFPEDIVE